MSEMKTNRFLVAAYASAVVLVAVGVFMAVPKNGPSAQDLARYKHVDAKVVGDVRMAYDDPDNWRDDGVQQYRGVVKAPGASEVEMSFDGPDTVKGDSIPVWVDTVRHRVLMYNDGTPSVDSPLTPKWENAVVAAVLTLLFGMVAGGFMALFGWFERAVETRTETRKPAVEMIPSMSANWYDG